ncbi:MAG: haloacid dehalogenase [Anaerolineales bacterium]|nr:MAG: haloacid dehalogenase [Anaerolineales bacterium]
MDQLDSIGERIRQHLEDKNAARERALQLSRKLISSCSKTIRAVHRREQEVAVALLAEAGELADDLQKALQDYPELVHAGYTQSALKEFAEASIVHHLVSGESLPEPETLGVGFVPYLGGLAEAAGEMRRRILDILRHDELDEAERLLEVMDEIYGLLVTIDFPDALTNSIRRTTDMVRGVTERTRGDLTTSSQQRELKRALEAVEKKLNQA